MANRASPLPGVLELFDDEVHEFSHALEFAIPQHASQRFHFICPLVVVNVGK